MKFLIAILFALMVFVFVVGGGALIWYLSYSAEFSQKNTPEAVAAPESENR